MKHWLAMRVAVMGLSLGAAVVVSGGCQAPDRAGEAGDRATRLVSPGELAVPPGVERGQLRPLEGEALARARKPLASIIAELPTPSYVAEDEDAAERAAVAPAEPGLEAQRAYLNARQALREGRYHEAIDTLRGALRIEPGQPELLRSLARAYGAIGNRLRAVMYFREALEADPGDLESLFVLGRLALEQGEHDEAIVVFHRLIELAEQGDAQPVVSRAMLHYHLAAALLESGYAAAAIEQHRLYDDEAGDDPHALQEIGLDQMQRGATWAAIGDAHHRLGDARAAHAAYERAADYGLEGQPGLVQRQVYTYLALGDAQPAVDLAIAHVRATEAGAGSLELVRYLTRQGVSPDALAAELRELYHEHQESGAVALAIAELLPRDRALALLRGHLHARPDDEAVYRRALRHWLLPNGAAEAPAEDVREAVVLTAGLMRQAANAREASERAEVLLRAAGDDAAVLAALVGLPEPTRRDAMVRVLEGFAHIRQGEVDAAAAAFEQGMLAEPDLELPRLQLAQALISRGQYERAGRLLEPLEAGDEPLAVLLRARVLAETDRADEALALLSRAMARRARPAVDMVVHKALLEVHLGDVRAAERTLLDGLHDRPEEERLYGALLELYSPTSATAERIADAPRQRARLVRQLFETIPHSRLARLVRAQLLEEHGQRAEAEALLRQLLVENPRDREALVGMVGLYLRWGRRDDARELVERKLEAHPEDAGVLSVAHAFYQQVSDHERAMEMVERLLALEPATVEQARNLALLYMRTNRPEQAVDAIEGALAAADAADDDAFGLVGLLWRAMVDAGQPAEADERLEQLIEQAPQRADDLTYERAMLAETMGERERSEALLREILERDPEHAAANNALGYTWAVQNRNLEQARAMIQRAVDAEPDNAAFLDSLGWVYYKLGQFDEAVIWLRRSRSAAGGEYPIIVDHLGDALYRLGRADEAVRAWRAAQRMLREQDLSIYGDPELDGLEDRLARKIEAVAADRPAPVAKLPGEQDDADEAVEVEDDAAASDG